MHRLLGLVVAGGIVLGHGAVANAQFALSVGNPYTGTGFAIGTGYGYGGYGYPYGGYSSYYSAPLVGATTYSSGYAGYVAPATTFYSSSYYPAAAAVYAPVYAPVYPAYGYRRAYGYAPYGRYAYGGWRGGWRGRGWRGWR